MSRELRTDTKYQILYTISWIPIYLRIKLNMITLFTGNITDHVTIIIILYNYTLKKISQNDKLYLNAWISILLLYIKITNIQTHLKNFSRDTRQQLYFNTFYCNICYSMWYEYQKYWFIILKITDRKKSTTIIVAQIYNFIFLLNYFVSVIDIFHDSNTSNVLHSENNIILTLGRISLGLYQSGFRSVRAVL